MNKITKYKAQFGQYDNVQEIKSLEPVENFILVSDEPSQFCTNVKFTKDDAIRLLEKLGLLELVDNLDNKTLNRIIKIYPFDLFSDSNVIIYCDSHIIVKGDLTTICQIFIDSHLEWQGLPHRYSNSLLDEIDLCYVHSKVSRAELSEFKKNIITTEAIDNLYECGFFARKCTQKVKLASRKWLELYLRGPNRDQLHVLAALRLFDVRFGYFDFNLNDNTMLEKRSHKTSFLQLNYNRIQKLIKLFILWILPIHGR